MFECFTDRARKVMQLANQEAQRLNRDFVGTEHILLGIVKEGTGVAANVLKNLDIDLDKVRSEVESMSASDPHKVVMSRLPLDPQVKMLLEAAIKAAKELGHNYVGTEHVLLGLLWFGEGLAAQILRDFGVTTIKVRIEIDKLLSHNTRKIEQETFPLGLITALKQTRDAIDRAIYVLSGEHPSVVTTWSVQVEKLSEDGK